MTQDVCNPNSKNTNHKEREKKKKSTKDIKGMASWALNQKIAFYVQRKC